MVAVVIGLVLIVTIAAGIVAMVAAPRLREGEELLTPGGKQTIVRAGQQARDQSAAAAGTTWHWVASLRARLSATWAPASRVLHERLDRLEGRSQPPMRHVTGPQPEQTHPDQLHSDQTYPDQTYPDQTYPDQTYPDQTGSDESGFDQSHSGQSHSGQSPSGEAGDPVRAGDPLEAPIAPSAGAGAVGRPRPMPYESGPIPIEDDDPGTRDRPVADDPAVINLRGREPEPAPRSPRPPTRISPDVTTRRIR